VISLCTRSSKSTPVIAAGLFLLAVIPTVLLKLKAVMYAVKVVIPRERCKIEVFLLQTTITKCSICSMCIYFVCLVQLLLPNQIDHYYMIYRIAAILMTLRDFQVIHSLQTFSSVIFCTVVQQLTGFQLTIPVIAELLGNVCIELILVLCVCRSGPWVCFNTTNALSTSQTTNQV